MSWSPNGTQIAFDTGQQPTPQPNQLARLEADPATLQVSIVDLSGANPHLLHGAPAGMPAWRPVTSAAAAPRLAIRLEENQIVLTSPTVAQPISIESSTGLGATANWQPLQVQIASSNGQSQSTIPTTGGVRYFRLRL